MADFPLARRGSLTEAVIAELSSRIESGSYAAGQKLPTESELCREFGVSRTVLREAVASLRLSGRLFSRQGIGIYVADQDARQLNFDVGRIQGIRSAMQILEFRLGVELEAVSLAATRRTPEALAEIIGALDRFALSNVEDAEAEADADFEFHLAIARATGNPHFPNFLKTVARDIGSDLRLKHAQPAQSRAAYLKKISREHGGIVAAITQGDARAASRAMRQHLEEGLNRYRRVLGLQSASLPLRDTPGRRD